jgi:hypothetical protein
MHLRSVNFENLYEVVGGFVLANNTQSESDSTTLPPDQDASTSIPISVPPILPDFNFTKLNAVGGGITISSNSNLSAISFPELTDVGYSQDAACSSYLVPCKNINIENNDKLLMVDFNALINAGGSISMEENRDLSYVGVRDLESVQGSISFGQNENLDGVELSSLLGVQGNITFSGNSALRSAVFPSLTTVGGDVRVDSNTALASIRFPNLISIGGDPHFVSNDALINIDLGPFSYTLESVRVTESPASRSVVFAGLTAVTGDVRFESNAALTSIRFPDLIRIGGEFKYFVT